MVFQDPYSSLNPSLTIEQILIEPLTARGVSSAESKKRVGDLLDYVRLPGDARSRLPREFSGGQRQRIAIARALALDPKLIVCDEPVSALDLSTQARVLDLFIEIQERTGVAYLFISHDLAVVRHISHRVAVMYRGEIVETGAGRPGDRPAGASVHPAALHGRARARPRPAGGPARRAPPPDRRAARRRGCAPRPTPPDRRPTPPEPAPTRHDQGP